MSEQRAKYGNRRVEVGGIVFASAKEARRYQELVLLERAGEITNLQVQPEFELAPPVMLNGRRKPALRFLADFSYVDTTTGETVIEDVKSPVTARNPVFRLKKHLLMSVLGLEVTEV